MLMERIPPEFIDDLTGIYNRRYFIKQLQRQLNEADKNRIPLSIALIDLDHFKNVNDTYGHAQGDSLLKEFAEYLRNSLRQNDMAFRYGGDEFVCLLYNTDYEQGLKFVQRLIDGCRSREFARMRVTLSIGIASFPEQGDDPETLFNIADQNLYWAKRHGRDQVGIFKKEKEKLVIPTKEIIGRDKEIQQIKQLIESTNGTAIFISGEVGIGKTRLVHEISNLYKSKFRFWESDLSIMTKSIPYYPFREIVQLIIKEEGRDCIKEIPMAYQTEFMKLIPELSDTQEEMDREIFVLDKFRLYEGMRKFLELQSAKLPIMIFLDNVHWADDGSLELVHYLVKNLKNSPVFFFFVYRVEEINKGLLYDIQRLLSRELLCEKIELNPLNLEDIACMLSLIADATPSIELTNYIFSQSGGNPFFVEELIKSLKEKGALSWKDSNLDFDQNKKIAIPHTIEDVIARKLDMLSPEAYKCLEYAAVIGREFNFSFLKELIQLNEGQLLDALDELFKARLMKEKVPEHYYFSEDIIREIVYRKIGTAKLRLYHLGVGERLLQFHKDKITNILSELSSHFYLGGDKKRAVDYSISAAKKAEESYAFREAINLYTRALECLSESGIENAGQREIEYLLKRALALSFIGEKERAALDLKDGLNKARERGDKKLTADCLDALCSIYQTTGQYKDALALAEEAFQIYQELNDDDGRASILNTIGTIHWAMGKFPKALEFYQEALKIRERLNDLKGIAGLLSNIGMIYSELGEYKKALELYQNSLKIRKEINERRGQAASLNNIGSVYSDLGDHQKALEFYESSLKIKVEIGDRNGEAGTLNNIGNIYKVMGKYKKALEFYQSSLKIFNEIGNRKAQTACLMNSASLYHILGEYPAALELCNKALSITSETGDRRYEAEILLTIGDIFLEEKDYQKAEELYKNARLIAEEIKSKTLFFDVCSHLTSFYLTTNNLNGAERELANVSALAAEIESKADKARSLLLAGRLFTKKKMLGKANASFIESSLLYHEMKEKLELGKVYFYQALLYKELGESKSAKEFCDKARVIFEELGAKGWLEKLRELNSLNN